MNELKTNWKKILYHNNTVGYIFSFPFLFGFFAFTLIPVLVSVYYSLTNYKLGQSPVFIGLENYKNLFSDDRFLNSVKVTLIYVITSVPSKLIFALFYCISSDSETQWCNILPVSLLCSIPDWRKHCRSTCLENHFFKKRTGKYHSCLFWCSKTILAGGTPSCNGNTCPHVHLAIRIIYDYFCCRIKRNISNLL